MLHQQKNITLTYNEVAGYKCNSTTAYHFLQHTTIKEHYYSSNTSLYDPALARMLSPDNYVPNPHNPQAYNRYSYCLNDPLKYVDPEGNHPLLIAALIGASFGTYTGWKIGKAHGAKGEEMFGYILGGAIVGGVSGFGGAMIASGSFVMANTLSIAVGSFSYSSGMAGLSSMAIQPSISIGFGSYNFETGDFRSIFKWKNLNKQEKIGYSFGAMANLSDVVSLLQGGGQNIKVNSAKTTKDDWWGHSAMTDENGNTLVSVGPDSQVQIAASLSQTWQNSIKGANVNWDTYLGERGTWSVELNNVSTTAISKYASGITRWDLLLNSCVGHTTRALWSAGIPTIYAFHPYMLNLQLLIRQLGIYSSPYLYQIP